MHKQEKEIIAFVIFAASLYALIIVLKYQFWRAIIH